MNATLTYPLETVPIVRRREYSLSLQAQTDMEVSRAHPARPLTPIATHTPQAEPIVNTSYEPSVDDLIIYD
jgi:hypothetical protein